MTDLCTPAPLIFDIVGPFIIHFKQGTCEPGTVKIYGPACSSHHANIITDTNDISLYGLSPDKCIPWPQPEAQPQMCPPPGWVYRFKNPTAPTGAYKFEDPKHPHLLLRVHHEDAPIPAASCHLMFEVPCPNRIEAIRPENVFIHQNHMEKWFIGEEPPVINSPRATAVRFVYDVCSENPEIECKDKPRGETCPDLTLTAVTLPLNPQGGVYHYGMTLRMASSQPSAGQEDAYNSFKTMRGLFPEMPYWRVDFDHEHTHRHRSGMFQGGKHPSDCGASVIILQDWV